MTTMHWSPTQRPTRGVGCSRQECPSRRACTWTHCAPSPRSSSSGELGTSVSARRAPDCPRRNWTGSRSSCGCTRCLRAGSVQCCASPVSCTLRRRDPPPRTSSPRCCRWRTSCRAAGLPRRRCAAGETLGASRRETLFCFISHGTPACSPTCLGAARPQRPRPASTVWRRSVARFWPSWQWCESAAQAHAGGSRALAPAWARASTAKGGLSSKPRTANSSTRIPSWRAARPSAGRAWRRGWRLTPPRLLRCAPPPCLTASTPPSLSRRRPWSCRPSSPAAW
mmetsp:Transcript_2966/g.7193  ORF Transcript_2966/g.7193 Transcript_2966/m.7193 type:complete len:282 (+) Transcript_2966:806-1651(+)